MSLEYIQSYYQVPAQIGRRVSYADQGTNRQGVIVGHQNQYIIIHLDGEKKPRGCFHPTHGITYLETGKVPKVTRAQARYARYRRSVDCFGSFREFLAYEAQEKKA